MEGTTRCGAGLRCGHGGTPVVVLATTGTGGADLSPFAAEHFPFMSPDFTRMTTPALIVAGRRDSTVGYADSSALRIA